MKAYRLANSVMRLFTFNRAPDRNLRDEVIANLDAREPLPCDDWVAHFAVPNAVSPEVAAFVYGYFVDNDLPFGSVRPEDDLERDLRCSRILWSDWELDFNDTFCRRFGIVPYKCTGYEQIRTIGELLIFLTRVVQGSSRAHAE